MRSIDGDEGFRGREEDAGVGFVVCQVFLLAGMEKRVWMSLPEVWKISMPSSTCMVKANTASISRLCKPGNRIALPVATLTSSRLET
jgi:hypothetical protein